MHYIWWHRLFRSEQLMTNDGRRVRVIDTGLMNDDAGPDFFNAKIQIDNQTWVGNVEIHVRASDWFRHNHNTDPAYDSVILHVVQKDDAPVRRSNGEIIPQMVLNLPSNFNDNLHSLMNAKTQLPCAPFLQQMPSITVAEWLDRMAVQRLQNKAERTLELLEQYHGSWEDVCYITLSRNLGFGVNNDAFERLAKRTPLRVLQKHSDSLLQIEAILFGQAGLLNRKDTNDKYVRQLNSEYSFLAGKFSLNPLQPQDWKLFRIRPQNFPYRRIALLAHYIHNGFRLMNDILEASDNKALRALFDIQLTGYWMTHYALDGNTANKTSALSANSIDIILINTVATLLYAHGTATGDSAQCDKAINLLESIKPEQNKIVQEFKNAGLKCDNALTSQAMIELKRNFCEAKKCIYCKFGHHLLVK